MSLVYFRWTSKFSWEALFGLEKDVNMAAGRRVDSLYDLAAFTTVRSCNLFKSEFRSLPNAVQCDLYRTVCILILSFSSFHVSKVMGQLLYNIYKIWFSLYFSCLCLSSAIRHRQDRSIGFGVK